MNNFANLGERFNKYLKHKGLGNNKTAEILEFSGSQVSNIINGRVFGTDKMFKILNVFQDIDANWLFRNEGEMLKTKSEENVTKKNSNINSNIFGNIPNVKKMLPNTELDNSLSVIQAKDEIIAQLKEQIQDLKQDKERAYKDRDNWEYRYNQAQLEIYRLKNVQEMGDTHAGVG